MSKPAFLTFVGLGSGEQPRLRIEWPIGDTPDPDLERVLGIVFGNSPTTTIVTGSEFADASPRQRQERARSLVADALKEPK